MRATDRQRSSDNRTQQQERTPLTTPDARGPRDGKPPQRREPRQPWGIALDLGMRLGLSVVIGIVGGVLVDGWLGTSPIFTLVGVAVGIGAAMYTIWDVARDYRK
ncbi:MAG TPA: AtpZ/AtpI family protein [Candidatus Limnocylindria bacterium]|nr:AtpZ/AtpI family protein [Candidatus Limnocylindria bacterium]